MIYGYARVSTKGQARDGNSLDGQATQKFTMTHSQGAKWTDPNLTN